MSNENGTAFDRLRAAFASVILILIPPLGSSNYYIITAVISVSLMVPAILQPTACSFGLSATSQQHFSLRTNTKGRGSSQVRETAERTKQPGVMWFLKSFKYSKIDDKRRILASNTAIMLIPNFCANLWENLWENFEVM
jgi:type III secretory pathway component EscR